MTHHLLVYGDIAADILVDISQLPSAGEDATVRNYQVSIGGSAANCAVVASRIGAPTSFMGFVGTDTFGSHLVDNLINQCSQNSSVCGETFKYLLRVQGKSGVTFSFVDSEGERTFLSYRGVNATGLATQLPLELCDTSSHLHLTGYSFQDNESLKTAKLLLETALQKPISVSLDPSHSFARDYKVSFPDLLEQVDVLLPNREEAALLSGNEDPERSLQILLDLGPTTVIIKLGAEGCVYASKGDQTIRHIPAIVPTKVIDTTGAGDSFCGGYLAGQISGLGIKASVIMGLAAASQVVSSSGATTGAPTYNHLKQVLTNNGYSWVSDQLTSNLGSHNKEN
jgi:ribokinase